MQRIEVLDLPLHQPLGHTTACLSHVAGACWPASWRLCSVAAGVWLGYCCWQLRQLPVLLRFHRWPWAQLQPRHTPQEIRCPHWVL